MKYLISLDWFQYCCVNIRKDFLPEYGYKFQGAQRDTHNRTFTYYIEKPKERHAGYRDSFTVYSNEGMPLVHLHFTPTIPGVPNEYVAAKVDNRLLYSCEWGYHLHSILEALQLRPNNITRADLCIDFQRFENGDYPTDFIKNYVKDGFGDQYQCYIRKHSNRCFPVLTKMIHTNKQQTSYFVDASQAKHMRAKADNVGINLKVKGIEEDEEIIKCESIWEYVRWGSRSSAVSVYMYDKTREMRECKAKPYIYDQWEENGVLELTDEQGKPLPVYRVEISITSKALEYRKFNFIETARTLDKDTIYHLRHDNFSTQLALEDVFWSFAAEYFCFYRFEGQKHKKNMPIVQLFPQECLDSRTFKPVAISRSFDTGRMEKLAANTFDNIAATMLDIFPSERMSLQTTARILRQIAAIKNQKHKSMARKKYNESEYHEQDITEVLEYMIAKMAEAKELQPFEKLWHDKNEPQADTQLSNIDTKNQQEIEDQEKELYNIKKSLIQRVENLDLNDFKRSLYSVESLSAQTPEAELRQYRGIDLEGLPLLDEPPF